MLYVPKGYRHGVHVENAGETLAISRFALESPLIAIQKAIQKAGQQIARAAAAHRVREEDVLRARGRRRAPAYPLPRPLANSAKRPPRNKPLRRPPTL